MTRGKARGPIQDRGSSTTAPTFGGLAQRKNHRHLGAQLSRYCLVREVLHALMNQLRLGIEDREVDPGHRL